MSYLTNTNIENIGRYGTRVLFGSVAALVVIVALSSVLHKRFHYTKKTLFALIVGVSIGALLALVAAISILASGGSKYEVKNASIIVNICGQDIERPASSFLSSAQGTSRHTFGTDGTLRFRGFTNKTTDDATLGKFFESIGGGITTNSVAYPVENKLFSSSLPESFVRRSPIDTNFVIVSARDNDKCSIVSSKIETYVYQHRETDGKYILRRVKNNVPSYQISNVDYAKRDCVVVRFTDTPGQNVGTCHGYPGNDKIAPGKGEDIL
jgi:hypothetical protein